MKQTRLFEKRNAALIESSCLAIKPLEKNMQNTIQTLAKPFPVPVATVNKEFPAAVVIAATTLPFYKNQKILC